MNDDIRYALLSKVKAGTMPLVIPILDPKGTRVGELRPFTDKLLVSDHIIDAMTRWRNEHASSFLTQFEATPARTRNWLLNTVLPNPSQLLFLIHADHAVVGQYGFKELQHDSVFADNLLRGERLGHSGLMPLAVTALTDWLFSSLDVSLINGFVFSDNAASLMLHKHVGFSIGEKFPLTKTSVGQETRWVIGDLGAVSPDNKYYQRVFMRRAAAVRSGIPTPASE